MRKCLSLCCLPLLPEFNQFVNAVKTRPFNLIKGLKADLSQGTLTDSGPWFPQAQPER